MIKLVGGTGQLGLRHQSQAIKLATKIIEAVGGQNQAARILAKAPRDMLSQSARVSQSTISRNLEKRALKRFEHRTWSPDVLQAIHYLATTQVRPRDLGVATWEALCAEIVVPNRKILDTKYREWLRAELDHHFDRDPLWRKPGSPPRDVPTPNSRLFRREFEELLGVVKRECPADYNVLTREVKKTGRGSKRRRLAWIRILEPLLQWHESGFIEPDLQGYVTADGGAKENLKKFVTWGVRRELMALPKC
jgi:hypothetical protein